jgi:hypothetical protein
MSKDWKILKGGGEGAHLQVQAFAIGLKLQALLRLHVPKLTL